MQFAKNNEINYSKDNNNNNNDDKIEDELNNDDINIDDEFLKDFLENKPKEFIEFLNNNNIPLDSYNVKDIPRYIRIKNQEYENSSNKELFLKTIEDELNTKLIAIKWLPYFYKLENSNSAISFSNSYKSGIIYGMDASSGAAILALNPKPGDNVLDICCAPGTKLCMISDMIGSFGTITGVDLSYNRLGICRTILNKYKIQNVRLFCTDGTTFDSLAPNKDDPIPQDIIEKRKKQKVLANEIKYQKSNNTNSNNKSTDNSSDGLVINSNNKNEDCTDNNTDNNNSNNTDSNNTNNKSNSNNNNCSSNIIKFNKFKRKFSKRRAFDLKDLYFSNQFYMRYSSSSLYDKVIVDAECSLDASIRHLIKHSKMGRHYQPEQSKQLTELQKGLIENGFRLLKVGGSLVYSTCSFSKDQNEEIVQFLLDRYQDSVKLVPAFEDFENNNNNNDDNNNNQQDKIPYSIGFIPNTYRFYPKNGTSGMFISKFQKLKDK